MDTTKTELTEAKAKVNLKRLLYSRPKIISFINYRKEFKGKYPIRGILPNFNKYWSGKIWQLSWRGFAIQADFRGGFNLTDLLTEKEKVVFYKRVELLFRKN